MQWYWAKVLYWNPIQSHKSCRWYGSTTRCLVTTSVAAIMVHTQRYHIVATHLKNKYPHGKYTGTQFTKELQWLYLKIWYQERRAVMCTRTICSTDLLLILNDCWQFWMNQRQGFQDTWDVKYSHAWTFVSLLRDLMEQCQSHLFTITGVSLAVVPILLTILPSWFKFKVNFILLSSDLGCSSCAVVVCAKIGSDML